MNQTTTTPLNAAPDDTDLAKQAHPGRGIPSQDPSGGAQFPLACDDAGRENKSVLMGGGLVAGAATGAAVGVVIAGPVGVLVGGTVGAVVGTLGAVAAGTIMSPGDACEIEDAATISPMPTDPAPIGPVPVNPSPIDPAPIGPSPVGPAPIGPGPINPSPMDPLPVNPVASRAEDSASGGQSSAPA